MYNYLDGPYLSWNCQLNSMFVKRLFSFKLVGSVSYYLSFWVTLTYNFFWLSVGNLTYFSLVGLEHSHICRVKKNCLSLNMGAFVKVHVQ